jgi:tRNA (adenine57-N1/adenine58-N1)-methyltransferase catalytic subunit
VSAAFAGAARPSGPLAAGDRVLLIDRKDRRYLIRLVEGGSFQSHAGVIDHDDLIGAADGGEFVARQRDGRSGPARRFLALRPTLSDLVVKMPRGAQVIYPKDLGAILMAADVHPGARVLEAGVGSGALSMTLLGAGADVVGYELREDFAARARANVADFLGENTSYRVEVRDVYEGIDEVDLDRVILDLAEPWRVVPHAAASLVPGGIFLAYLPTINQTAELRQRLDTGGFALAETFEILRRTWHVEGRSVRPDHRMVAHTGFITTARRVSARWHETLTDDAAVDGDVDAEGVTALDGLREDTLDVGVATDAEVAAAER